MLSELDCKLQKLSEGSVLKSKTILNTPFHERPQGWGKTGICSPQEIGTKKQKFVENVKSAV